MPDVVVVGGGHNGLCAAAVLALAGVDVEVFEQRARVGGAAATEELFPGYRFSTCAYALHLLHEAVVEAAELDVPEVLALPPPAAVLPGGDVVRPPSNDEWERGWREAAAVVDAFVVGAAPSLEDLRARAREDGVAETFERFARSSIRDVLSSIADAEERALLAPRYFEGLPDEAGGPLAYAYLETGGLRPREWQGIPRGGMGTVAAAFERAARGAGARIRCSERVAEVVVERGRARGVKLENGRLVEARAVLSERLEGAASPPGPGGAKLHCALRGAPDVAGLGDEVGLVHVYPSVDWFEHAVPDALAEQWPERSLVELQLPTLVDPSLAPRGCHCLSAYLPFAPPGLDRGDDLARLLLERAGLAVSNLGDVLVDYAITTPADLERRLGLPGGAIHHVPHVPRAMFDGRPPIRTPVDCVYRCGAATHPGGEVSGVPGLNAARVVLGDL